MTVRIGVLGGSGYTGRELLRILARHEGVEVTFATSRSAVGDPTPIPRLRFTEADLERAEDLDALFLCLPHGAAAEWVQALPEGPRIIDLTADHRPGSGRESAAVYGLAELNADEVAGARLVANPGCYPTGVIGALRPLLDEELVDRDRLVVVNAASGVTGAGRTPRTDLLFAEVEANFRAYGEGNRHRHLREMRALLEGTSLLFQPHLLPVSRGILETIIVPVPEGVGPEAIRAAWEERYGTEGAVRVRERRLPELRDVVGTDLLALGAAAVDGIDPPVVTVVAALDNLGKGAAGQAVQNFNRMFGLPANQALRLSPP